MTDNFHHDSKIMDKSFSEGQNKLLFQMNVMFVVLSSRFIGMRKRQWTFFFCFSVPVNSELVKQY